MKIFKVENQAEYVICKNAASQSMDDAMKYKQEDMDLYFHKLCGIMDNYLRCCRPFVNDKCGPDAWKLVSQVLSSLPKNSLEFTTIFQITMDSLHVTMPTCDVNRALL